MAYDLKDVRQAALGSLIAVLFFFLLRAGDPININPKTGLLVGLLWLWISTSPFITSKKETKTHAFFNIAVALFVSSVLALTFGLVTKAQLQSFEFFGTAAWLGMLLAIPAATFFDKENITNPYDRWFKRR